MGTVLRLRRLLDLHSGVGLDADALYLLGQAYAKVNMPDRARKAWERLIEKFPRHQHAGDARAKLQRLPG
jgi:TolA-binding protein